MNTELMAYNRKLVQGYVAFFLAQTRLTEVKYQDCFFWPGLSQDDPAAKIKLQILVRRAQKILAEKHKRFLVVLPGVGYRVGIATDGVHKVKKLTDKTCKTALQASKLADCVPMTEIPRHLLPSVSLELGFARRLATVVKNLGLARYRPEKLRNAG